MDKKILNEIIAEHKSGKPPIKGDLFQVDYFAHGYEKDRFIHTVIGLFEEFIYTKNTQGVILLNPLRIIQQESSSYKLNFPFHPFKLLNDKIAIDHTFNTQVIPPPKEGVEIVDLTKAKDFLYGADVIEFGTTYYNSHIFGKNFAEIVENLNLIRTSQGFEKYNLNS